MKNSLKFACLVVLTISAFVCAMESANKADHILCVVLSETDIVAAIRQAGVTKYFSEVATEISDIYNVKKD